LTTGVAGFHHPLVRAAKALQHKKHRRIERCFLVEGPNAVTAALDARARLQRLFYSGGQSDALVQGLVARAAAAGVDAYEVDARTLEALAQTREPQGVIAVAAFVERPIAELPLVAPAGAPMLALVLHDLADPGNAGTLVRSAEAFGACAVCFGRGAVEPYNDKLVRASAGALFRVAICAYDEWEEFAAAARAADLTICAAETGAPDVRAVTVPARVALLVGHERHGFRDVPPGAIAVRIGITQSQTADSLNASVAGSIALYELSRVTGVLGPRS
jgi:TrmH family RNA methyltransferase